MNILVCLKQVPDTAKVKFNRETNTLDRTGVENIMNPYDRQALEVALCLKDKEGAKVTVLTMGLPQATDILKEAIAMGADKGVLVLQPVPQTVQKLLTDKGFQALFSNEEPALNVRGFTVAKTL